MALVTKITNYKCPESNCNHYASSNRNLSEHIISHHTPQAQKGIFTCNVVGCKSKFDSEFKLTRHIQRVHNKKPNAPAQIRPKVKCSVCKKDFANNTSLKNHFLREHTAPEDQPQFNCDQCNSVFVTLARLKRHIIESHGERKICCDKCSFKATTNHAMKQHKASMH